MDIGTLIALWLIISGILGGAAGGISWALLALLSLTDKGVHEGIMNILRFLPFI